MIQPFRLLIIDDHEHAREAMREIISLDASFEIVAEGCSGQEAIDLTEQWMPDLILMDIQMKGMDGLEATRHIKDIFPYVKIVIVTISDDITHLFEALKKGAQGYLMKNLQPDSWLEYIKAIAIDEVPMSRELAFQLLEDFLKKEKKRESKNPLTAREKEVLQWVAQGQSNRVISEKLVISEHTVKNHMKNILQKLHLENRVQLASYAYEQGWIHRK